MAYPRQQADGKALAEARKQARETVALCDGGDPAAFVHWLPPSRNSRIFDGKMSTLNAACYFCRTARPGGKSSSSMPPRLHCFLSLSIGARTSYLENDPSRPRADLKKPWKLGVSKRAGLDGTRIHDLRHTYASFWRGKGTGFADHREAPLAHAGVNDPAIRARLDADPPRRASEQTGEEFAAALEGVGTTEVIQIRKRPLRPLVWLYIKIFFVSCRVSVLTFDCLGARILSEWPRPGEGDHRGSPSFVLRSRCVTNTRDRYDAHPN